MTTKDRELREFVRTVPDFPKKGVEFYDIGPLLRNPIAFRRSVDAMTALIEGSEVEAIVALESRGFVFGSAIAYAMHLPLVLVRKLGKLPGELVTETYEKEYGKDVLEIQKDILHVGARVAIVDDIIATGGSAEAVHRLLDKAGVQPLFLACLAELGAFRIKRVVSCPVKSLMTF